MPPRKSNISQATTDQDGGTPVKERDGSSIEVQLSLRPLMPSAPSGCNQTAYLAIEQMQSMFEVIAAQRTPQYFIIQTLGPASPTAQSITHPRHFNERFVPPQYFFQSSQYQNTGAPHATPQPNVPLPRVYAQFVARSLFPKHIVSTSRSRLGPPMGKFSRPSMPKAKLQTQGPKNARVIRPVLPSPIVDIPYLPSAAPGYAASHFTTTPKVRERASDVIDEQDLSLPRTMVQRLAKGVLPSNTQINKDAILALSKGATLFVNYLAQAAHEANQATSNKKTIQPASVLVALQDLEFESFMPRVDAELKRYNEVQTGKRNDYRKKVKEGKAGFGSVKGERGNIDGDDGEDGDEEGRAAKRIRREEGDEMDTTSSPGARREYPVADPNSQLQQQIEQEQEADDEYFDPPDDDGDPEMRDGRIGDEEDGDEDEDDDDEDEFPDEGRRLSSVERENYGIHDPDRNPVSAGNSEDEDESD